MNHNGEMSRDEYLKEQIRMDIKDLEDQIISTCRHLSLKKSEHSPNMVNHLELMISEMFKRTNDYLRK